MHHLLSERDWRDVLAAVPQCRCGGCAPHTCAPQRTHPRVDALFLWNVASWDLLGIHWRSYSTEGSYYEPGVVSLVGGGVAAGAGPWLIAPAALGKAAAPSSCLLAAHVLGCA